MNHGSVTAAWAACALRLLRELGLGCTGSLVAPTAAPGRDRVRTEVLLWSIPCAAPAWVVVRGCGAGLLRYVQDEFRSPEV